MIRTLWLFMAMGLAACTSQPIPSEPKNSEVFQKAIKSESQPFADPAALALFEQESGSVYHLGEGDQIDLSIWNRPELSAEHVLGPDGRITVPLIGSMRLATMTTEEASSQIRNKLRHYYKAPVVNLSVKEYKANRVTILGRVLTPGTLQFDAPPLLLDVLARAGSLPVLDKQATLTRCAIFRGREKIIWVDLKSLLNRGALALNIRLKPNDLVYIPDSFDTLMYVMGEVQKPGAYRLTPDMSVLDALAQAGGPNEDGIPEEMVIYRPGKGAVQRLSVADLYTAQRKVNFALEEGDILYVPKKGIAQAGYVLRQLLPGLSFMTFAQSMAVIANP